MRILVIGEPRDFDECSQKFGSGHAFSRAGDHRQVLNLPGDHDVVFDFIIDKQPEQLSVYADSRSTVFLNTAKISLGGLAHSVGHPTDCTLYGFNGLPGFLNRSLLEVAVLRPEDSDTLKNICRQLGTEYHVVADRAGLVTPRVVCMIINEAYFTVQEGTATREDIDKAMKLGTNYPFGPFEWCRRIGIGHVYEVLKAVYEETKDERYNICPLLKEEYLGSGGA